MIRVGIIGTGGMANSHAQAAADIRGVKLTACCDISREKVDAFAAKWESPAAYIDYAEMLEKEKLDAVMNVTSDDAHCEVALAVLKRGLHLLSEKPLAANLKEARKMKAAAEKAGVVNMVNFSYRNSCGLQRAAKVIAAGKIGRIIHVESSYLQSWLAGTRWDKVKSTATLWRLSTRHGSAGVLGDLGCHIYDLTTLLAGDIDEIQSKLKTFDKGVPGNRIGEYVLDANDSFISQVTFKNGAIGTIHSSRWATGQGNSLRARVYGDEGAIEVDLDDSYEHYKICSVRTPTWKKVQCKPTPNMWKRFFRAIKTAGKTGLPAHQSDFANGCKIQAYLHYSIESDKKGQAVKVRF